QNHIPRTRAFHANLKSKQRHFINTKSQTRRLHTKHYVMNSTEIFNHDAISECFHNFVKCVFDENASTSSLM
ncbi:unnamed protein product, partial [Hymenolepis diminuta]